MIVFSKSHLLHKFSLLVTKIGLQTGATETNWSHAIAVVLKPYMTQLPGRLFSPSDISKKLSHHFLLHFPIGMGSYDHHAKYQGVFMGLL